MGERTHQIERQIAETRSELSDNLGELQDKVKSAVDWRTQFQQRPGTFLAVAFGGGIVLSALLPASRHSRRDATPHDSAASKPSDTRRSIEAFTGALLGVAVNQASGFLDSLLPGFHQEFTKAKDKESGRESPAPPRPLAAKASA
jgi:hypothetical protein